MAKTSNINIAYIGGGSREWAHKLMRDLALEEQISGNVRLYDIDRQAAEENRTIGNMFAKLDGVKSKWDYQTAKTIEEALDGADFVVLSILPGTFKEMASDVHLPEKYGIYQSVGDTAGPGGLVRGLRTIPIYVEFAEKIKEYAPKAWVINYTNPMALCVRTLYEVFPEIKAFGCCHEVFGAQELLAAMVMDLTKNSQVTRDDIKINVLGVNHFTWIDQATFRGMDLFPLYREFSAKYYDQGFVPGNLNWEEDVFRCANRVKFDLFKRYGLIAAAGDRHLAEFLPPWYLKNPATVKSWKFHLTSVDFRVERRSKINQQRQNIITGLEELELKPSGEEGVRQIKALLGLGDLVTNVNQPNRGQIKGLPLGAVVESNAWFSGNGIQPMMAGELPSDLQNLVIRHALNQETILKAALHKDPELAFHGFLNEPLVTIDLGQAWELFRQMLVNTKDYLPGWKL